MALVNIQANFSILLSVLERIAVALECQAGPEIPLPNPGRKKRGPESVIRYGDDERSWTKENFQNLIHEEGLAPAQEQEVLNRVMKQYEHAKAEGELI